MVEEIVSDVVIEKEGEVYRYEGITLKHIHSGCIMRMDEPRHIPEADRILREHENRSYRGIEFAGHDKWRVHRVMYSGSEGRYLGLTVDEWDGLGRKNYLQGDPVKIRPKT
tara:strand:+ start:1172 stop:1504 length:333 start_codon:yes stop_codon:yes gene_type:complete